MLIGEINLSITCLWQLLDKDRITIIVSNEISIKIFSYFSFWKPSLAKIAWYVKGLQMKSPIALTYKSLMTK